jgi:hypothetical protein
MTVFRREKFIFWERLKYHSIDVRLIKASSLEIAIAISAQLIDELNKLDLQFVHRKANLWDLNKLEKHWVVERGCRTERLVHIL